MALHSLHEPDMVHSVNSLLSNNRVALGVKRTTTSVRHARPSERPLVALTLAA